MNKVLLFPLDYHFKVIDNQDKLKQITIAQNMNVSENTVILPEMWVHRISVAIHSRTFAIIFFL